MTAAQTTSRTLHDGGLRWQVLAHTNLQRADGRSSGAAIAWLRISPSADLETALLNQKDLMIEETGVVAFLHVKNRGRTPILLPSDLIVDGGKQARVVEQSLVIPSNAELDVPVRCVEAGRWQARDAETATKFRVTSTSTVQSRAHFAKLKQRSYHDQKGYSLDQSEVWSHVSSELKRTRTTSGTSSYTAYLSTSREERVEEAKRIVSSPGFAGPAPGANALALIKTVGSVWIEVLPSHEALQAAVATAVADGLEESAATGGTSSSVIGEVKDASRIADEAMAEVAFTSLIDLEAIKGATSSSRAYALNGTTTAGQVLLYENRIAHLVATVG